MASTHLDAPTLANFIRNLDYLNKAEIDSYGRVEFSGYVRPRDFVELLRAMEHVGADGAAHLSTMGEPQRNTRWVTFDGRGVLAYDHENEHCWVLHVPRRFGRMKRVAYPRLENLPDTAWPLVKCDG